MIVRELRLEGAANFRDLGGLPAGPGWQTRTGRLFRSDALSSLTDQDLLALAPYGLKHVIDLRSPEELERYGRARLEQVGALLLNSPMIDVPGTSESDMVEMYLGLLDANALSVQAVFAHLVNNPEPTVMHCAAGKDRTGLTIALLLSAVGVEPDDIAADYAISEPNMVRLLELRGMVLSADIPTTWMEARAETMLSLLERLSDRWGSATGYLQHIGVDDAMVEAVRRELIVAR